MFMAIQPSYLEYFPAHISLFSNLRQFCLQSYTLLPEHLCQTVGLLQILLHHLKTQHHSRRQLYSDSININSYIINRKATLLPSTPPCVLPAVPRVEAGAAAGLRCCRAADLGPVRRQVQLSSDGYGTSPTPSAAGPSLTSSFFHASVCQILVARNLWCFHATSSVFVGACKCQT